MTARADGMDALALPDVERRLANTVRFGTVIAVDHAKQRLRVRSGELESDWLPWPAGRAGAGKRRWDAPEVGEQGVMLAPGGDLRQAVFVPGVYQDAHAAPSSNPNADRTEYGDGTVIEYDRATHTLLADLGATKITADRSKLVLECNGSKIELSAAGIKLVGARIDLN